jgi:hypothetical protein
LSLCLSENLKGAAATDLSIPKDLKSPTKYEQVGSGRENQKERTHNISISPNTSKQGNELERRSERGAARGNPPTSEIDRSNETKFKINWLPARNES